LQAWRRLLDLAQHFERGRHDFMADAVAGQDGDMKGGID